MTLLLYLLSNRPHKVHVDRKPMFCYIETGYIISTILVIHNCVVVYDI